jgi:hypothetical protein
MSVLIRQSVLGHAVSRLVVCRTETQSAAYATPNSHSFRLMIGTDFAPLTSCPAPDMRGIQPEECRGS